MELDRYSYQDPRDSFVNQLQPLDHNSCAHCWVFLGKIARNGVEYDVFQNFITGHREERNARNVNLDRGIKK